MTGFEFKLLVTGLGVVVLPGLLLLSALSIRYRVTATHLQVTWLGLPVRRLNLQDIKRIGTRPVMWAERWPNSWERGRVLVIRRHTGWFRNLVITPHFPFEFRNTLERARNASKGEGIETLNAGPTEATSNKESLSRAA